jgi:hypothetical protein
VLLQFSATLLRIADVRQLTKELQKDLPGSNPNIQMPDLRGGSAGSLQSFHKTGSVGSAGDQKIGSTKLC